MGVLRPGLDQDLVQPIVEQANDRPMRLGELGPSQIGPRLAALLYLGLDRSRLGQDRRRRRRSIRIARPAVLIRRNLRLRLGRTPDQPNASGTVNRVVQGVRIHTQPV